jgi:hypothetical protein
MVNCSPRNYSTPQNLRVVGVVGLGSCGWTKFGLNWGS